MRQPVSCDDLSLDLRRHTGTVSPHGGECPFPRFPASEQPALRLFSESFPVSSSSPPPCRRLSIRKTSCLPASGEGPASALLPPHISWKTHPGQWTAAPWDGKHAPVIFVVVTVPTRCPEVLPRCQVTRDREREGETRSRSESQKRRGVGSGNTHSQKQRGEEGLGSTGLGCGRLCCPLLAAAGPAEGSRWEQSLSGQRASLRGHRGRCSRWSRRARAPWRRAAPMNLRMRSRQASGLC